MTTENVFRFDLERNTWIHSLCGQEAKYLPYWSGFQHRGFPYCDCAKGKP